VASICIIFKAVNGEQWERSAAGIIDPNKNACDFAGIEFLSKKEYESQVMPWKATGDFFSFQVLSRCEPNSI
jgi:hypothetical protein